jgi:signal transduction histidine kinase
VIGLAGIVTGVLLTRLLVRPVMQASNRRLRRRNRELSALNAISRDVTGTLGLVEVMERALQQALGLVHAAGGWICLLGKDGFCQIYVRSGALSLVDDRRAYCHSCDLCREAQRTGQTLVIGPCLSECSLLTAGSDLAHAIVPLLIKERTVGLLNLVSEEGDGFEAEDLNVLRDLGRQLGVAIENARLWQELRQKEALRGQLLRKLISAQEEERQRIALELHDEAGQALTSLLVGLKAVERADSLARVHTLTSDLREVVGRTLDEIRDLALELRPRVLDDLGLIPALAHYVSSCRARFGLQAEFVTTGTDNQRLPPEVETTLYRIAQEALTNVARHADASQASVVLQRRDGAVVLVIDDDGVGFDVAQVMASRQEMERLGLYGIEERASLVGGRLTVESSPGAGTTVSVEIPLEGMWLAKKGAEGLTESHLSTSSS